MPEVEEVMTEIMADEKDGVTATEAVFRKLRAMALQGNMRAMELLLAYAYGKPKQRTEITGFDGGPIQTEVKAWVIEIPPDTGDDEEDGTNGYP